MNSASSPQQDVRSMDMLALFELLGRSGDATAGAVQRRKMWQSDASMGGVARRRDVMSGRARRRESKWHRELAAS